VVQTTKELARVGSGVRDVVAVEDLRSEFSFLRHPAKWVARQREIWHLLKPGVSHPDVYIAELKSAYIQVWLHVVSWTLLMAAAAGAIWLAFADV